MKLLAQKIYWDDGDIRVGDLDRLTGEVTNVEVIDVVGALGGSDFAIADNKVYWNTSGFGFGFPRVIFRANLDGSGKTLLVNIISEQSSEIAVNQERIVWTEKDIQIWTADLNGGGKTLLLDPPAFNAILDVVLGEITPQGTEVFWSGKDALNNQFVKRGIINGDDEIVSIETIVSGSVFQFANPHSLAVDSVNQRLYWSAWAHVQNRSSGESVGANGHGGRALRVPLL